MIYLDNNATTPIDPRVTSAMEPYLSNHFGNPASFHVWGWKAKDAVLKARNQIAQGLNVDLESIVFTSGATESNHTVIQGLMLKLITQGELKDSHFLCSEIEHKCVLEAFARLAKMGAQVDYLRVTQDGLVSLAELQSKLKPNTKLVSIMYANNEVGSINDVPALSAFCQSQGVLFHTDAAQALGKLNLDLSHCDFASFSAHKIYGPKGVGAMYIKNRDSIDVLMPGGGQEEGARSGTLNVAGIVGFGAAFELTNDQDEKVRIADLCKNLKENILQLGAQLNGPGQSRLLGNLNFYLPGKSSDDIEIALDDIAYSNGSACSSAENKPSYVLKILGLSDQNALKSIRFGIGRFTTEVEIEQVINLMKSI